MDSRNPAQRRHDALFAAIAAGYGRGKELAPGRGTTTIIAAVTLEQLAARTGTAVTDTGVRMTVDQLVETCDARDLFLQVMDFHGRSLFLGRSRRLGSVDQYLALVGEEGASSALIHGVADHPTAERVSRPGVVDPSGTGGPLPGTDDHRAPGELDDTGAGPTPTVTGIAGPTDPGPTHRLTTHPTSLPVCHGLPYRQPRAPASPFRRPPRGTQPCPLPETTLHNPRFSPPER